MSPRPEFLEFDVGDATLGALAWPGLLGAPTVIAVPDAWHTAWTWDPLAHHLAGAARLVAVDLRGRGRSLDQPGSSGIRRHADDLARVVEQLDAGPVHLVGHGTGAVVALMTAERHPDLVRELLLIDGGTPTGDEVGSAAAPSLVDATVEGAIGADLDRLQIVWPDRVSYLAAISQSPAHADSIGPDLERNLLADLVEVDDGFRVAVDVEAVRADGRDLLGDDEIATLLERRTPPATIIRAEFGPDAEPPGVIAPGVRDRHPQHRWVEGAGLNHSTIVASAAGARLVADTLRSLFVESPDD